jgi:hypothetical protein
MRKRGQTGQPVPTITAVQQQQARRQTVNKVGVVISNVPQGEEAEAEATVREMAAILSGEYPLGEHARRFVKATVVTDFTPVYVRRTRNGSPTEEMGLRTAVVRFAKDSAARDEMLAQLVEWGFVEATEQRKRYVIKLYK